MAIAPDVAAVIAAANALEAAENRLEELRGNRERALQQAQGLAAQIDVAAGDARQAKQNLRAAVAALGN